MTVNCSDEIPISADFFTDVSIAERVCIILSGVVSLITLGLFIETTLCLRKRQGTSKSIFFRSIIILGLYPTMSIFAFLALCFPRAFLVCKLCASIYISIAMYNFIAIVLDHFDGIQELLQQTASDQIRLRFPPFCCFCCVPPFMITSKVIKTVYFLVGQSAIFQVILSLFSLVSWLEDENFIGEISADNASLYMIIVKVISLILGVGGLRLMARICKSFDEILNVDKKSRVLVLILVLHNAQGFVFNILASNDIPECSRELSSKVKGRAWEDMILIVEMFLLGVVARCLMIRPRRRRSYYTPIENEGFSKDNRSAAETSFLKT